MDSRAEHRVMSAVYFNRSMLYMLAAVVVLVAKDGTNDSLYNFLTILNLLMSVVYLVGYWLVGRNG